MLQLGDRVDDVTLLQPLAIHFAVLTPAHRFEDTGTNPSRFAAAEAITHPTHGFDQVPGGSEFPPQ